MRLVARVVLVVLIGMAARSVTGAGQGTASDPSLAGALSGVVVDGATGRPIAGAVVSLGPASAPSLRGSLGRQITDSRGRFVFTGVAPNELVLSASHAGYLDGGYSQTREPGTSSKMFSLSADQWLSDVRIELWKPGAISGVVRDENGDASVGVEVRALAIVRLAGHDHFAAGPATLTDDRGAYRLAPLGPGRYVVAVPSVQSAISPFKTQAELNEMSEAKYAGTESASRLAPIVPTLETAGPERVALGHYPIPPPPSRGIAFSYPLTFAPGAADVKVATVVTLGFGDERTSLDVQLTPLPAGEVRGRLEGPGQVANLIVRLASVPDLAFGFETATARTGADGSFRLANVPAGSYTLDVPVRVQELQLRTASLGTPGLASFASPRPPGLGSFNGRISTIDGALTPLMIAEYSPGGATITSAGALNVINDNPAALSARSAVTVAAGAPSIVTLRLETSGVIAGEVRFDGARGSVARLVADPADGNGAAGMRLASTTPGGNVPRFAFNDLAPGRYFIRSSAGGTLVKSVLSNGREYATTPLDVARGQRLEVVVTLASAGATLTGTVIDLNGRPASDVQIAVFPADSSRWTDFGLSPPEMRASVSSHDGTYTITSLPAGDYFVAAVPPTWNDRWRDPEFFAAAASTAARATLDWGGTRTLAIRLGAR